MKALNYTEGFKRRIIQRLCEPGAPSAVALAREIGVSNSTLSRWKHQILDAATAHTQDTPMSETQNPTVTPLRPRDRSAAEKLRLVFESRVLDEEALGAFLRREGIHKAHLEQWNQEMLAALSEKPVTAARATNMADRKRVRELETELARKDKALAEAAALLMLQKKVQALWGDGV